MSTTISHHNENAISIVYPRLILKIFDMISLSIGNRSQVGLHNNPFQASKVDNRLLQTLINLVSKSS